MLELNRHVNPTHPFWSTDALRGLARYVFGLYNEPRMVMQPAGNEHIAYVKTDYIDQFMSVLRTDKPLIIISGDSDTPFTDKHLKYLDDPRVQFWFSINCVAVHPKLAPLPIGIPDSRHASGLYTANMLRGLIDIPAVKRQQVCAYYNIGTGAERPECFKYTGVKPRIVVPLEAYLDGLRQSYFSLSPCGNGLDCWRTWELLYCSTVPVVTATSPWSRGLEGLPVLVLPSWAHFDINKLTPELYTQLWAGRTPRDLYFEPMLHYWWDRSGCAPIP